MMSTDFILPNFCLDDNSSDKDIITKWNRFAANKYGDDEFLGHLAKIDNPYVEYGTYNFAKSVYNLRILINTAVALDWYGKSANFYSEFQNFSKICPPFIQKGDVIFDCGAHHGLYSMLFAKETGSSGKVYGFELVPINSDLARLNADINSINNITIIAAGVADKVGRLVVSQQNHSILFSGEKRPDDREIFLVPLDDFSDLEPNFIKIDVEGAEISVLRGATKLLKKPRKWVISLHPSFILALGDKPDQIFDFFPPSQYNCYIIHPNCKPSEYYKQFPIETFCELAFFPL